jgi:hypothetical protein
MGIVRSILLTKFGFTPDNILMLDDMMNVGYIDSMPEMPVVPTRQNVLAGLKDLLEKSKAADVAFLYFDGHGGSVDDTNGDEADGFDETLGCSDGGLLDDEVATYISQVLGP